MRTHSKTCLVPVPDAEAVPILSGVPAVPDLVSLVGVTGGTVLLVLVGVEGATSEAALVDFVGDAGAAAALLLEVAVDDRFALVEAADVLGLPGLVGTFSAFRSTGFSSPFFPPFLPLGLTAGSDVEGTSIASSDSGVASTACCEAVRMRFLVVSGTLDGVGLPSALRFRAASF